MVEGRMVEASRMEVTRSMKESPPLVLPAHACIEARHGSSAWFIVRMHNSSAWYNTLHVQQVCRCAHRWMAI